MVKQLIRYHIKQGIWPLACLFYWRSSVMVLVVIPSSMTLKHTKYLIKPKRFKLSSSVRSSLDSLRF